MSGATSSLADGLLHLEKDYILRISAATEEVSAQCEEVSRTASSIIVSEE